MNYDSTTPTGKEPLKHVVFTAPRCRYEATAPYTNNIGQKFLLVATGLEQDEVDKFIQEINVAILVAPDDGRTPEGTANDPKKEGDIYQKEEGFGEETIDLTFEILDTPGIDPPYLVKFTLDPRINVVSHSFSCTAKYINVTIIKTSNGAKTARLQRNGNTIRPSAPLRAAFIDSPGVSGKYKVVVSGGGGYAITGEYRT